MWSDEKLAVGCGGRACLHSCNERDGAPSFSEGLSVPGGACLLQLKHTTLMLKVQPFSLKGVCTVSECYIKDQKGILGQRFTVNSQYNRSWFETVLHGLIRSTLQKKKWPRSNIKTNTRVLQLMSLFSFSQFKNDMGRFSSFTESNGKRMWCN